jgi:hypothetical protein
MDPKATKISLSQTEKKKSQPTDRRHTDNSTLNQEKECPPQTTSAAPKPWLATARKRSSHKSDSAREAHLVSGER